MTIKYVCFIYNCKERRKMTIQELYDWAKENNVLDYDMAIEVEFGDFGIVSLSDMKIDKDFREVIVSDY